MINFGWSIKWYYSLRGAIHLIHLLLETNSSLHGCFNHLLREMIFNLSQLGQIWFIHFRGQIHHYEDDLIIFFKRRSSNLFQLEQIWFIHFRGKIHHYEDDLIIFSKRRSSNLFQLEQICLSTSGEKFITMGMI